MKSYQQHLSDLTDHWQRTLAAAGFDEVIVTAGQDVPYLFDDQAPVFRPNPHFAHWVPVDACQGSVLVLKGDSPPVLHFLSEADYWHRPPELPGWIEAALRVQPHGSAESLRVAVEQTLGNGRVAHIGAAADNAWTRWAETNPDTLLAPLNHARAFKSTFEQACLRQAANRAVAGHRAAAAAFQDGAGELDIHLAYLAASRQTDADLPYPNIIAVNDHAGLLHYQHRDASAPSSALSFLIDAGARHQGYAADITRTYAAPGASAFAGLIQSMDALQQALLTQIRPGLDFENLHDQAHQRLAQVLVDHELVDASAETVYAEGITHAFLPHGLGHLIGLQTHDVGGHQQNAAGAQRLPRAEYPALRLTRTLAENMVLTIEPGLYFIPMLLERLRSTPAGKLVAWEAVAALEPYGGIRIEDNVIVTAGGIENLTRDAFDRHA